MRNPHRRMIDGVVGHRCPRCRLITAECLCALIPRVETRTRVIIVLHEFEDRKPSNTGRLAQLCLPNSAIVIRGGFERATEAPRWDEHGDPVLLFPHPDARPLAAWRDHPRPVTLVVPDGTWRQAQRVRRRIAGLAAIPCVSISRAEPSAYRLRRTPDPRRLATLEAIAEALGILEGPGPRQDLLGIFQVMVERSLRVRSPVAKPRAPVLGAENATPSPAMPSSGDGPSVTGPGPGSGDVDLGIEDPR